MSSGNIRTCSAQASLARSGINWRQRNNETSAVERRFDLVPDFLPGRHFVGRVVYLGNLLTSAKHVKLATDRNAHVRSVIQRNLGQLSTPSAIDFVLNNNQHINFTQRT